MPDDLIVALHDSQGGTGRHRCVVCAYAMGVNYVAAAGETEACTYGSVAPTPILATLPENQGGPGRHKCTNCAFVLGMMGDLVDLEGEALGEVAEAAPDFTGAVEGTVAYRLHKVRERSPSNRAAALLYHGNKCAACGFFFDEVYTPAHAKGFIEVHHVKPLSTGEQFVDPLQDLVPLCANCHRMVHRQADNWLSIDQLKGLLTVAQSSTNS
ncbi:MAG: HNH endonuclease [Chloroflexi bacterium]|nr:HNH endonuclease [Chloroflexota bacterium]